MPKNIIICFDGTGNEPLDALQKKKLFKVEDASISNILKLHFMFGGTLQPGVMSEKINSDKQLSLYYSGVGTYGNGFQNGYRGTDLSGAWPTISGCKKISWTPFRNS